MEFIESPWFSKLVDNYLSDEDYATLQRQLSSHPESGAIIPASGGVRKLRWPGKGRGKRGGLRIIYYWRNHVGEIWLLTIYAKNETQNIKPEDLRKMRKEIES